jgi:DNA-binding transcriptional MerR regulator
MKLVTLSALVADTGETPRTLNHWTDIGILRPTRTTDRKGRGNRRYYAAEPQYGERKYALLASALNKLRLPLSDIKHLIYADRLLHDPVDQLKDLALDPAHVEHALRHRADHEKDLREKGFVFPVDAALAGEQNIYAVIAARPHDPVRPFQTCYLRQALPTQPWDDVMAAKGNNKLMVNLMSENTSAVVLNLSEIWKPLYSNPEPVEDENEAD